MGEGESMTSDKILTPSGWKDPAELLEANLNALAKAIAERDHMKIKALAKQVWALEDSDYWIDDHE
jgi:hypothetical protein